VSTEGLSTSPDVVVSPDDRARIRFLAVPAIVVGLVILGLGLVVVRDGTVPGWERSVFRAVNDLPEFLYRPLWPFQQLGALLIGPLVALIAVLFRRYRLAIALLIATAAKLVFERLVKVVSSRQRPGTSIGSDVHLRGDVSAVGESFVSGHAVLIAAIAGLVTPYLPGRWKMVPWVVVGLVMVTRVYVGAHNPVDVVCGAALGLAIAGLLNLFLGPRAKDRAA
jgi:membrane-associated phospholipid phosphatase